MNERNNGRRAVRIDATGLYYRDLNQLVREAISGGARRIELEGVMGQRYIGTNVYECPDLGDVEIHIHGVPGNDLGAFLNGPRIVVYGSAQDGCGNTMNAGEIVVHGRAGDIAGFSARGGRILVRESAGYRVGIHMKEYGPHKPVLVIGGSTQDFLGEYMAGGVIIVLGLGIDGPHRAALVGTGMHGGAIYIRGEFDRDRVGKEVGIVDPDAADMAEVEEHVRAYTDNFGGSAEEIIAGPFSKLYPKHLRPYGRLYAY
ncbi:MAG: hypothetical protein HYX78_09020 [Armatimonadetes bacterium]|nr:hypothetical protein [Armatimonadota bacterium]